MTNDLEKQFFDTFGIEPKPYCCYHDCNCPINDVGNFNRKCPKQAVTKECDARIIKKPQITDRILLELICVINRFDIYFDYYYQEEYQVLRETILEDSINLNCKLKQTDFSKLKHQVQALFEEG